MNNFNLNFINIRGWIITCSFIRLFSFFESSSSSNFFKTCGLVKTSPPSFGIQGIEPFPHAGLLYFSCALFSDSSVVKEESERVEKNLGSLSVFV
ncbi:hypothetical protein BpHYR1_052927 [Brachionus plicatilis]|uniref:Uncharacterized protein n=1 Tax=Brachionus plicatilis TaxID=10195 RepID=A0A3M7S9C2_BRAPC|nr:hypothetical protein BpHYR1_052927 [Brachionus plicatilis]